MSNTTNSSEIVINRMYAGDYLQDNLGHEVINMYKTDRGENYLYLNPLGSFDVKHTNCVKNMLLVRSIAYKSIVEVIGLAEGLEDVCRDKEFQGGLTNTITYGGVSLRLLFDDNEDKQDCYVTFKARRVWMPETPTFIAFADADIRPLGLHANVIELKSKAAKSSLKQYFSAEDNAQDYDALKNLFSSCKGIDTTRVNIENLKRPLEKNFFEICGIDNSELAFSNAFAYFLEKYPSLLSELAAEHGLVINHSGLTVIREKENNIDLYIETASHIIVVENKVLSDINGVSKDKKDGKSQLSKYYKHVQGKSPMKGKLFILLTPDHNNVDLTQYDKGEQYHKLFYSTLLDFLKTYISRHVIDDAYFQMLLQAMEKHTHKAYSELYEKTSLRLYQRLRMLSGLSIT